MIGNEVTARDGTEPHGAFTRAVKLKPLGKLTQADIGYKFVYYSGAGEPEVGVLSSYTKSGAFLRFTTGCTAAKCSYDDLYRIGHVK